MAEGEDGQEKTEEATPKRMEKAREEGQLPRSRDLTTTVVLLAGTTGLYMFGAFLAEHLLNMMSYNFSLTREQIFDTAAMFDQLGLSMRDMLVSLLPLFGILLVASIIGPIALGGWNFSSKAMAPQWKRMNPASGLKRMFGVQGLMELAKSLAKVSVLMGLAVLLLMSLQEEILGLADQDIKTSIVDSLRLSGWVAIVLSASTLVIVIVDVPFQIWQHTEKMKMSRQEVKDEYKNTEGKPEVKGRIRQLQREMANQRMMAEVPQADVVITNPTHFSVALKYNPETMETPILIAKGADEIALKIREIANAHKVEILQSPALARSVFYTTELNQEIPAGLYFAVAQVLAYVFGLKNHRKGQGDRPVKPNNLNVPPDLYYD